MQQERIQRDEVVAKMGPRLKGRLKSLGVSVEHKTELRGLIEEAIQEWAGRSREKSSEVDYFVKFNREANSDRVQCSIEMKSGNDHFWIARGHGDEATPAFLRALGCLRLVLSEDEGGGRCGSKAA